MTWWQKNAVSLIFSIIAISGTLTGVYVVLSNTDVLLLNRMNALEKSIEVLISQKKSIIQLQLSVNSLELKQKETERYWKMLSVALTENTKVVQSVHTSLSVFNERWLNHETRLNACEGITIHANPPRTPPH